ncbi:MAG: FAD:protein FMN transferase [Verrucomicrobiota bacterium]
MHTVVIARNAMATRFEIVVQGDDPVRLRAAAEEALEEIERLESKLSLFQPTSELSAVNARAAYEPVRVTPELFRLLEHSRRMSIETGGAFDPTIAPLMRLWGFTQGSGLVPDAAQLEATRAKIGMDRVELNAADFTVHFPVEGMRLDLGAIGKGFALDQAADILREAGVNRALLHGGTSTVYALGRPFDADFWKVAVPYPQLPASNDAEQELAVARMHFGEATDESILAVIALENESLSVSAPAGKFFLAEGKSFGHVLDPRTGHPVQGAWLAAVVLPSATETDALSTALLTVGPDGFEAFAGLRPGMKSLVVGNRGEGELWNVKSRGIELQKAK